MILIKLKADTGAYFADSDLSEYEIDRAKGAGIEVLAYSYSSGSYEGSGHALLRKDGKWAYMDLGHCSCYGPLDTLPDRFEQLSVLRSRLSDELQRQTAPLFERIQKRGLDLT